MTAKELSIDLDYRLYKTVESQVDNSIIYSAEIKEYKLSTKVDNLYIPIMYAVLKVTGEDLIIPIDLNHTKQFNINISKNTRCLLYTHKDFKILRVKLKIM